MNTFYNDIEPYAAQWLRNLIDAGKLSPGAVSETSIVYLTGFDVFHYKRAHFFAGIGGWELALQLAGWPIDQPVWTGSCPCQPFSVAGQRKGEKDERHLWPYFRELIRECRPLIVFGEQVASKDGRIWLSGVRSDLEAMGYAVGAADLCAAGVSAPHIRQRLYWVAFSRSQQQRRRIRRSGEGAETDGEWASDQLGGSGGASGMANTQYDGRGADFHGRGPEGREANGSEPTSGLANVQQQRLEGYAGNGDDRSESGRIDSDPARPTAQGSWSSYSIVNCADGKARRIEPGTFPLAHGVPKRVDKLRAYGNAIVPQVAAEFIKAVMEIL